MLSSPSLCSSFPSVSSPPQHVVDVFEPNLQKVMAEIHQKVAQGFCYVAFDTEFPGLVGDGGVGVAGQADFDFETVAKSVNMTNLVELGLTLYNNKGERPADGRSTFVFHFKWVESRERFNMESINLLKNAGINFSRSAFEGISNDAFAYHFSSLTCVIVIFLLYLSFF